MVIIAVLASTTVLAASGYGFVWSARQARHAAQTDLSYRAERAASGVTAAKEQLISALERLAANPAMQSVVRGQGDGCVLQAPTDDVFASVRIEVVAADGQVKCSSNFRLSLGSHAGSTWLAKAIDGDSPMVLWDAVDPMTDAPSVVVATPLKAGGATVGAAAAFLYLPSVGATIAHDERGALPLEYVLEDRGSLRVLSFGASASTPEAPELVDLPTHAEGVWSPEGRGGDRLYAAAPVPGSPLRVMVMTAKSAVTAGAWGTLLRQAAIAILTVLVLIVGLALLDRRVGRPLRLVTAALDQQRGGTGFRAPVIGAAEVKRLARSLNRLHDVRDGHEAQLAHQLSHDMLTGLPNRSLLRGQIEEIARSTSGASVVLAVVGLDRFKSVNDGLGDAEGDEVLRTVADRVQAIAADSAAVARTGGDEFSLLSLATAREHAVELAERLLAAISEPIARPSGDIVVQATAGVTQGVTGQVPAEAFAARLMREAGAAVRHAKITGRRWSEYDETLDVGATYQLRVENELRLALQRRELVVHYQPLVDIRSGVTTGAEALVRWHHPERGMVPPLEFISVAEASGQINDIGAFVLRQACRDAASWARSGRPIRVSVNVAVSQIERGDFPQLVQSALIDSGHQPDLLCLEITESSIMRPGGQQSADLQSLRDLGVHLAVDDFGTGYSSLAYLHQLPVTELKIDRSFVSRLQGDARDRHMVKAILTMAAALGLDTVAEGVEDDAQLSRLREWGCTTAQGYLFAAPAPLAAFNDRLHGDSVRGADGPSR
jgi:diguanylate cyclase (GGDEF)-like protein